MENTQVQKLHHREEGNGEGDGGGKGEEKGMHFGESDGDSDGLGDTERNNSADVNEGGVLGGRDGSAGGIFSKLKNKI